MEKEQLEAANTGDGGSYRPPADPQEESRLIQADTASEWLTRPEPQLFASEGRRGGLHNKQEMISLLAKEQQ
jgi:hypothetical protein